MLDRSLASEAGGIAKRGRAHFTDNLVQAVGSCRQPENRYRMVEEVTHDLKHLSALGGANHPRAHQRFRLRGTLRQIAHPWWIEWRIEKPRQDLLHQRAFLRSGRVVVFRKMHPRPTSPDFAGRDEVRDQRLVQCRVEPWKNDAP